MPLPKAYVPKTASCATEKPMMNPMANGTKENKAAKIKKSVTHCGDVNTEILRISSIKFLRVRRRYNYLKKLILEET